MQFNSSHKISYKHGAVALNKNNYLFLELRIKYFTKKKNRGVGGCP